MGIAASHLTRHFRRFNVIERTERIINKEKPIAAPLHKVDAERLKHLLESNLNVSFIFRKLSIYQVSKINKLTLITDNPGMKEELANKDSTLEKNLKNIYVKSEGDVST
jgi:hypothetical protein